MIRAGLAMEAGDILQGCTIFVCSPPQYVVYVTTDEDGEKVVITDNMFVIVDRARPIRSRWDMTKRALRAIWAPLK